MLIALAPAIALCIHLHPRKIATGGLASALIYLTYAFKCQRPTERAIMLMIVITFQIDYIPLAYKQFIHADLKCCHYF